jgi:hypothetical protein
MAKRRLARLKKSGAAIPFAEVFDYLSVRARGEPAVRPRPRKTL